MTQEPPGPPLVEEPRGSPRVVRVRARGPLLYYERSVPLGGGLGTVEVEPAPEGGLRVRVADVASMHRAQAEVPGDAQGALSAALRDPVGTGEVVVPARVELARFGVARSGEGWVRVELAQWEWEPRDVVVVWVTLGIQRLGVGVGRDDLRREVDP